MPMPKPRDGESHDDFSSRCMGNDTMVRDFPDQDQRFAVCEQQWESGGKHMNPEVQRALREVMKGQKFQDVAKAFGFKAGSEEYTTLRDLARKKFEAGLAQVKAFNVSMATPDSVEKKTDLGGDEDDRPGRLIAVFSTFNIMDDDGDIVVSEAVHPEKDVPFTFAHNWSEPSMGKGDVRVDHDRAVWDGHLFVEDMTKAKETFASIKNMGDRQEYSWSFLIKAADIEEDDEAPWGFKRIITDTEMIEVCAAIRGINRQTHTLLAKSGSGVENSIDAGNMFQVAFDAAYAYLHGDGITTTESGEGDKGSRLEDQITEAQALLSDLMERVSSLAETRAKENRAIGKSNLGLLAALKDDLDAAVTTLEGLLESKSDDDDPDAMQRRREALELFADSARLLHAVPSQ